VLLTGHTATGIRMLTCMLARYCVLVVYLCAFAAPVWGASQMTNRRVDSLKSVLNTAIDKDRVQVLNDLAWEYRYNRLDTSFMYASQAQILADKIGDSIGAAQALRTLGLFYESSGKYDMALDYQFRALALFEQINDRKGIASTTNITGEIYRAQGRYKQALLYYRRALEIHKMTGNRERIATILTNICASYLADPRLKDSSLDAILDTLRMTESLYLQLHDFQVYWAWYNIGEAYQLKGDFVNALRYSFKARTAAEQAGGMRYVIAALHNIGMSYNSLRKYDSALYYAAEARSMAQRAGFRDELKESYHVLSHVHNTMQRFDSALHYYKLFTVLKDSLLSAEMQNNTMRLQMQLATATQQQEIKRLSLLRNSLMGGVLLMILLALVIWNRYRLKKQSADELRRTNDEILRQQSILEKQATEIELTNTELQSTIESVHQRNYDLAELNREKNEILAIVAHDLKNPVSNVRMLSKLLRDDAEKLTTSEVQEFSGDIYTVSERMFELITTLLDVSAIEQGTLRFSYSVFEITSLAENVAHNYKARAGSKDITLNFEQNQNEEGLERYPIVAYADKNATIQVLDNIVSNAIKYSPYGKNVWVRVLEDNQAVLTDTTPQKGLLAPSQEYVRIEIQDEGPGLTAADKEKVFGKFTRLSAKPTAGEHSTGLGLSIVKRMVEGMNGAVWVESEHGKGATFVVLLPKGEAAIT
jgi:signal transduction histidine kinase